MMHEQHTPMGGPKPKLVLNNSSAEAAKPKPPKQKQTQCVFSFLVSVSFLIHPLANVTNNNTNTSSNTPTQLANKDNVNVKWGYGIKGNTRVILDEKDSAYVEAHFQVRLYTML
jgi:hypothetical protein